MEVFRYELVATDNNTGTEKEWFCLLNGENWKSQHNFEQGEDRSSDYAIQHLKLFRNDMNVRFLHALLR